MIDNKLGVDKCGEVCHTISMKQTSKRIRLTQTTWVLGDTDTDKYRLLWCDRQRRAKRNKPAKLNGIVVTNSIEVFHEL